MRGLSIIARAAINDEASHRRANGPHTQCDLLIVNGVWQHNDDSGSQIRHLIPKHLVDMTHPLGELPTGSRDFH